jgi:hypothetical protein
MAVAAAPFHGDVVGNLPTDAVAVVVSRRHVANRDATAVLQEDAARVVAVEVFVVRPIAVQSQALDADVGDILAVEQGEETRDLRLPLQPKILPQRAIQFEAIATAGPWDDVEGAYLPDGDLVFCSTRARRYIGCWLASTATRSASITSGR